MGFLEIKKLSFSYKENGKEKTILHNFNLEIPQNKISLLYGQSGLGKTTLLNLIGGLLKAQEGEIIFQDKNVCNFTNKELEEYRANYIGYIFQMFYLIPQLTCVDNVIIGMKRQKASYEIKKKRALEILKSLGIEECGGAYPEYLSGGQQQRVAIARAVANESELILADEPTGNLDETSAMEVFRILEDLRLKGKTIVIVSHDEKAKHISENTIDFNKLILGE